MVKFPTRYEIDVTECTIEASFTGSREFLESNPIVMHEVMENGQTYCVINDEECEIVKDGLPEYWVENGTLVIGMGVAVLRD